MTKTINKTNTKKILKCILVTILIVTFVGGAITFSKLLNRDNQVVAKASTNNTNLNACPGIDVNPKISTSGSINYLQSWVANCGSITPYPASIPINEGRTQYSQSYYTGITVDNDGTVVASSYYDEGHRNLGIYKDGQYYSRYPWDLYNGDAISHNSKYVFASAIMSCHYANPVGVNQNNLPKGPRPCGTPVTPTTQDYLGLHRYRKMSGQFEKQDPGEASFPTGYGIDGALLKVDEAKDSENTRIGGIFATETELFVSSQVQNKIKVYDAETMVLKRDFSVPNPDEIRMDKDGYLWIISKPNIGSTAYKVVKYDINGAKQPQEITNVDIPTSLTISSTNDLYIADNGQKQQIQVFGNLNSSVVQKAPFGATGGIYSGIAGKKELMKFEKIMGIGFDAQDNIYIAQDSIGLESYKLNGTRNWNLWGMSFLDNTVGFDSDPNFVYNGDVKMQMDYSQTKPGTEWSYYGSTLNPYKYPDDMRLKQDGSFVVDHSPYTAWTANFQGQKFMYTTDLFSQYIAGYRFNPTTDGEIAIPMMIYFKQYGNTPAWLWVDQNGDGKRQQSEITNSPSQTLFPEQDKDSGGWGSWVDKNANVWIAAHTKGLNVLNASSLNSFGGINYSYNNSNTYPTPQPFAITDAQPAIERLMYNPDDDSMIVTGWKNNDLNTYQWGNVGRTLVRYDNWRSGNPTLRYQISLPWVPSATNSLDIKGYKAITIKNNLILAANISRGVVDVYDGLTGVLKGSMSPDPDLNYINGDFFAVGAVDIPYGISAYTNSLGETVVFTEEDYAAKSLMWRIQNSDIPISSPSSSSTQQPSTTSSSPSSPSSSLTTTTSTSTTSSSLTSSSVLSSTTPSSSTTSTSTSTPNVVYEYKKVIDSFTNRTNLGSSTYNIPNQSGSITNLNDLSATVSPAWNNNGIFFEFNVLDNVISNNNSANAELQDGVEIMLDTNNSKSPNYDGVNDCKFAFTYSGVGNNVFNNGQGSNCSLVGISVIKTAITGGYKMNIYIPFYAIGGTGIDNQIIGWDTQVNDSDDSSTRKAALTLNNPNINNIWNTPSTWGVAKLLPLGINTSSSTTGSSSSVMPSSSVSSTSIDNTTSTATSSMTNTSSSLSSISDDCVI